MIKISTFFAVNSCLDAVHQQRLKLHVHLWVLILVRPLGYLQEGEKKPLEESKRQSYIEIVDQVQNLTGPEVDKGLFHF